MFHVPLTYFYDFADIADSRRPYIMAEFAAAGVKHLVLTDKLIEKITAVPGLEDILLKEMADHGLTFCDAHAPFNKNRNLTCPDPEKRQIMLSRLKYTIEIASYMKSGTITVHIGDSRNSEERSRGRHIQWIKESLSEIVPLAEKRQMTICLENIWHSPATPEFLNELMEEFKSPMLGICYDSGHANIMDNGRLYSEGAAYNSWRSIENCEPPWDDRILEKLLPNVVNCHLHDNMGEKDTHLLPGDGNIDWKKTLLLLKQAPRLKVIQSEVILPEGVTIKQLADRFNDLAAKFD